MKDRKMFFSKLKEMGENPKYNRDKTLIKVNVTREISTLYFFSRGGKFLNSNCFSNQYLPEVAKVGFRND